MITNTYHPSKMGNIGDGALITNEIPRSRLLQLGVQHSVEAASFVLITVDTILDNFRSISCEVIRLSLHWSNASIEEEQLQCFVSYVG
jgi:hypothetical protein